MGEESHSPDFRPIPLPGGDGVDGYGYVEGHQSLLGLTPGAGIFCKRPKHAKLSDLYRTQSSKQNKDAR